MKLGHIHLKVSDLSSAERFYSEILGLQVQERIDGAFVFLSYGEAHHDLALQQIEGGPHSPPALRADDAPGLYHSAFEVASEDEFRLVLGKLKAHGFSYALVDHGISWAAYTEDPSGNGVEVYLDRRRAPRGSMHWHGRSTALSEAEFHKTR